MFDFNNTVGVWDYLNNSVIGLDYEIPVFTSVRQIFSIIKQVFGFYFFRRPVAIYIQKDIFIIFGFTHFCTINTSENKRQLLRYFVWSKPIKIIDHQLKLM